MRKKVWVGFAVVISLISPVYGQSTKSHWVDSVFRTLDLDGKIGQVLMVPVNSYSDQPALEKLAGQVKKFGIGGIVFMQGGPVSQVRATNFLQQQARVPLLVGMNAEEGPGAVLDSAMRFPAPLTLGSIRDDSLLFFLGAETGRQLKALGVHINFAPTSDLTKVDTGRAGPLLRSYGENPGRVAAKTVTYQNGVRSAGILSVVKRSPDYGLVVKNVELGIQTDPGERARTETPADSNRLFPLTQLILQGSDGVVTTYVPGVISDEKRTYSTPSSIIKDAMPLIYSGGNMKQQLKFEGLAFSFIPEMRLKKSFKPGDSEALTLTAGNDVLLFPQNIGGTFRRLRKAIRKDKLLQKQLNESVKRILAAKWDAGLHHKSIINTAGLLNRINTSAGEALQLALIERSVIVIRNEQQVLPIRQLDNLSFASLCISEKNEPTLTTYLSKYAAFKHYHLQFPADTVGLVEKLRQHNVVVVGIFPNSSGNESNYLPMLQKLSKTTTLIVVGFGSLPETQAVENLPVLIQAFTNEITTQEFIPQLLFGAKKADGILPVSLNKTLREGEGLQTATLGRMGYAAPETQGLDPGTIDRIQRIALEAIDQKAAPGCQVLVARHGKIVYDKSFGWQTYENKIGVNDQTIYDLASLSKVMGTLQAVMFLQEKGIIDIYKKASVYLPELATTNKKDITVKDILTHQSGLAPFLLMWPQTVRGDTLLPHYYATTQSEIYPLQVAPGLYASPVIQDSIWQWVLKSALLNKPARTPYTPRYSDLGFMILHRMVERLINQPIQDFLNQNLYEPLGSATVGYLPLTRFPATQIAPTEMDTIFRKSIVLGTVHDERAAMLGGVAGHAGLFGSGSDLIKIGQMLLQKGSYGGQYFYRPETIDLFAQKQFENSTRGLGWAKGGDPNSPSSRLISPKAFGHTGFTGTCIWIDPEFDLVFVFLSNSRFPHRSGKLNTINIRSRMQDMVYQSIFNYCQYGENHAEGKLMQYLNRTTN